MCRKPSAWDAEILRAVKSRDQSAVLYTARPAGMRANQIPYELKDSRTNKTSSLTASSTGHTSTLVFVIYLRCWFSARLYVVRICPVRFVVVRIYTLHFLAVCYRRHWVKISVKCCWKMCVMFKLLKDVKTVFWKLTWCLGELVVDIDPWTTWSIQLDRIEIHV